MKKEQKFVPRPGQVDFTNMRWAPVINCVVRYKRKILIVQRSKGMRLYPEHWNGISGFLDDGRGLREKALEEIQEETGLPKSSIRSMFLGAVFDQDAPEHKKTWIVHPILVEVDTDTLTLDWEAQNYKWTTCDDALKHKLLPGFEKVLRILLKKRHISLEEIE
ncbi:MAG: NUDIX domain-containing protein [Candidatus Moraniibacteriota bacterium]|nr:MAG: NUDIX domain-containing protein [Candidatus Moranbacteria bacterium]